MIMHIIYALTFPMGIDYTLKHFYNRQEYIVAGMYETAFYQKYICNATSSVILTYPLQYITIVEIDCCQIKIIYIYMYHLYTFKDRCYVYP